MSKRVERPFEVLVSCQRSDLLPPPQVFPSQIFPCLHRREGSARGVHVYIEMDNGANTANVF